MDLSITPLLPRDSSALATLLAGESAEYLRHFTPFAFDAAAIEILLGAAQEDRYWALRVAGEPAGFFMLRGSDAGYARPSFGVYVASKFSGRGLARLALAFSLAWCRLNGVAAMMLKVDPANLHARRIYLEAGFADLALCPHTGQQIMEKRWP